jgi:protein-export membrane protein SecD
MASSPSQKSNFWSIVTGIVIFLCLIVAIPDKYKSWAPTFLKPSLHLGLDLAGGTQLDFRISEDEIKERQDTLSKEIDTAKAEGNTKLVQAKQVELQSVEQQHNNLVEAIRTVLERRINSLGVSEATITPSYFGSEKHLLVECPGVIDVDRCIATVGKTIQLEFKEEFNGPQTDYEQKMRARAEQVYRAVTTGTGNLQVYGQDLSSQLGVSYFDSNPIFVSALPKGLESIANRKPTDPIMKNEGSVQTVGQNEQGQQEVKDIKGIYITKVLEGKKPVARVVQDPHEAFGTLVKTITGATLESKSAVLLSLVPADLQPTLQTMDIGSQKVVTVGTQSAIVYLAGRVDGSKEMTASHILIQYKGAERADATVTRTKEQAQALINDIKSRLDKGANFDNIARTESDGPSKAQAGSLGVIRPGMMVEPFESTAFGLKQGEVSKVIETVFGYHIIRADKAATTTPATVTYDALRAPVVQTVAQQWADKVQKGEITRMEDQITLRGIFFSLEPTGWKDTDLNGRRFRSAAVTTDPTTNIPVVQIQFDEEGGKLFQELTKRNVGKRIAIFVGGDLVSAPTVQGEIAGGSAVITGSRNFEEAQALATDLNTGAIPAPIYLTGQTTIEPTLETNALQESVLAAIIGFIVLAFFLIVIYRSLGVIASLALLIYCVLLIASTKLPILLISNQYVVLTLAGIAGIILSIGMAVDANVLAFERIKEEVHRGKSLKTAVEVGFKKAWPSVRDGNFSTLITCLILFVIGTSIIRGFAVTLAIGIFISLFTAIIVSRWLTRHFINTVLGKKMGLFGIKEEERHSQVIQ